MSELTFKVEAGKAPKHPSSPPGWSPCFPPDLWCKMDPPGVETQLFRASSREWPGVWWGLAVVMGTPLCNPQCRLRPPLQVLATSTLCPSCRQVLVSTALVTPLLLDVGQLPIVNIRAAIRAKLLLVLVPKKRLNVPMTKMPLNSLILSSTVFLVIYLQLESRRAPKQKHKWAPIPMFWGFV